MSSPTSYYFQELSCLLPLTITPKFNISFLTTFQSTFYFLCSNSNQLLNYITPQLLMLCQQANGNMEGPARGFERAAVHAVAQDLPITENPQLAEKNDDQALNSKYRAELEWKKEIKHYFKALRKWRTHAHSHCNELWLEIALRMLDFNKKFQNSQIYSSPSTKSKIQSKGRINSKIITIINKPPKRHNFLVLVLSYRTSESKPQQIFYDLQLFSKSSRIIYKKINLTNWQQIHSEIERAKSQTSNLLQLLQNKSSLMYLLQRNPELQNLLNGFKELSVPPLRQPIQTTQRNAWIVQQIRDRELIYQVIERFQFIRGSLIHILDKKSYAYINIDEMLALTILHNIITILPLSHRKPLAPQMKAYFISISKHMQREHERQQRRSRSVALSQDHFPVHLENAQNCWRCKSKRGYIGCSTCSRTEGKNISLCLNCYENHHIELNEGAINKKTHNNRESAILYEQWSMLNWQVEAMVAESRVPMPLLTKSEESV